MNVFEAIKERRSCRDYLNQAVEDEKIRAILEAGQWSPSPMNLQPWSFYVVKNQEVKTRFKTACQENLQDIFKLSGWKWVDKYQVDFLTDAPVIIVIAGDPKKTGADQFISAPGLGYAYACSAAVQNMLLAAHALGLGTLWFTLYDPGKVRELIELPANMDIISVIVLGYPSKDPVQSKRKAFEETVTFID